MFPGGDMREILLRLLRISLATWIVYIAASYPAYAISDSTDSNSTISLPLVNSYTTLSNVGTLLHFHAGSTSVAIKYDANALPDGTVISTYLRGDINNVDLTGVIAPQKLISMDIAWVAADGSVPMTAADKPLIVTITDPAIEVGAQIYFRQSDKLTLAGTANVAGIAILSIHDDPEIFINNRTDQTIAFPALTGGAAGASVPLSATATSKLVVTFSSLTPSVCKVSGTSASIVGGGTCSITPINPRGKSFDLLTLPHQLLPLHR
jgi:hypothetical protein